MDTERQSWPCSPNVQGHKVHNFELASGLLPYSAAHTANTLVSCDVTSHAAVTPMMHQNAPANQNTLWPCVFEAVMSRTEWRLF